MRFPSMVAICVLALGLQACGHYTEDMAEFDTPSNPAQIEPAAGMTDFLTHLSAQYADLAKQENEKFDYQSAKLFTEKAMMAKQGRFVAPSRVSDYNIPAEWEAEADAQRERIIAALQTKNSPENYPALAKAQVKFDSWLENLDEKQQQEMQTCQNGFEEALSSLAVPNPDEVNYTLNYAPNQFQITSTDTQTINDIVLFIQQNPGYKISVIGYADGAEDPSLRLAERRALEVKTALVNAGAPINQVRAFIEGQQASVTPVSDGLQPEQNRRVNIILTRVDSPVI